MKSEWIEFICLVLMVVALWFATYVLMGGLSL